MLVKKTDEILIEAPKIDALGKVFLEDFSNRNKRCAGSCSLNILTDFFVYQTTNASKLQYNGRPLKVTNMKLAIVLLSHISNRSNKSLGMEKVTILQLLCQKEPIVRRLSINYRNVAHKFHSQRVKD